MTDNNHPITPPPELRARWEQDWHHAKVKHVELEDHIAIAAARWGADTELDACCEYLEDESENGFWSRLLRAARRPKPPSLKKQALQAFYRCCSPQRAEEGWRPIPDDCDTIRCALESLPD